MSVKTIPFTPVDTVWYRMDRPANHVMVTSVFTLDGRVDFERVKATLANRLLHFDRFHCRVVEHGFPNPTLYWEEDPYFDLDKHVHHVALPEPGNKQALLDLVADLATVSIDYERPLWQVHVVDNVDQGSAVVMRFHHCIADGTAMLAVSNRMFDTSADAPVELTDTRRKKKHRGFLSTMIRPAKAVTGLAHTGVDAVAHPQATLGKVQYAAEGVSTAAMTALRNNDPQTPLRGPLTGKQRVTYSDPVPLDAVRAIGKAHNATVNDVLVSAMAGALRHYMLEHGFNPDGLSVRAAVPVDLRPAGQAERLGNAFGLVFPQMPVGEPDVLNRLRLTKRAMDKIKRSPEAEVLLSIMALMGHTPKTTEDMVSSILAAKASLVFTNVAGPRQKLFFAGACIRSMVFWVPHPTEMTTGISILSYNGGVSLGVITDAGVIPDPEIITEQFTREFAVMREMTLVEKVAEEAAARAAEERAAAAAAAGTAPEPSAAPARPRTRKSSAKAAVETPSPAAEHCAATTKAGQPCKNKAIAGSPYCRVHQP
ncbi:MAG: wax ester/triacylglycerol synthase family O-acyltransferase [Anaerolineae bacterium]